VYAEQLELMNKPSVLGIIVLAILGTTTATSLVLLLVQQEIHAQSKTQLATELASRKAFLPSNFRTEAAPIAISGDNIYIVWRTNNTANNNDEIMFRASTDGGATFPDKINLSNTTGSESQDAEIAADGNNVIVTWWERNQTSEEPVIRLSTDSGQTFGSVLKLATNGTIGTPLQEEG
jgi:hypothetical protein